jgi:hypothetical protein
MSLFSANGTLNAGIGTGTPFTNGTFTAVSALTFSSGDALTAINSGGITFGIGNFDIFGDSYPLTTPPGGFSQSPAMELTFSGSSTAITLSVTARGGTLTSGSSSFVTTGSYGAGSVADFACNGTIVATSLSAGYAFGEVVVSCNGTTSTWANVTIGGSGTLASLNCLQFWQERQATAERVFVIDGEASSASETITLNTPTNTYVGVPVALSGSNTGSIASGMQVSLDTGTWETVSNFVGGASWSGSGPGVAAGTYTAVVRDSITEVESNIVTFVVGTAPAIETIALVSAGGTLGGFVNVTGTSNNGPPQNIDISLDGGVTWSTAGSYSTQQGTVAVPFSATGPVLTTTDGV